MKISTKTEAKLELDDNEINTLAKILILVRQTPASDPSFVRFANRLSGKEKAFINEFTDSMRDISMSG